MGVAAHVTLMTILPRACPSLQVAQAGGGVRQRVGPVDERCEGAGLDELDDGEQVLPRPGVRERSELLPDEPVGEHHAQDSRYRTEHVAG